MEIVFIWYRFEMKVPHKDESLRWNLELSRSENDLRWPWKTRKIDRKLRKSDLEFGKYSEKKTIFELQRPWFISHSGSNPLYRIHVHRSKFKCAQWINDVLKFYKFFIVNVICSWICTFGYKYQILSIYIITTSFCSCRILEG